jgi:broad specificity phosphatase PhoE
LGKTTTLVLVRHGNTPTTGIRLPGRDNTLPLSDKGRSEAKAAAELIRRLKDVLGAPEVVCSSPMLRARQTASIIRAELGIGERVRIVAQLNEVDPGPLTGRPFSELEKEKVFEPLRSWPAAFRFEGGESLQEARARCFTGAALLAERYAGRTVVAVSHADPIKLVLLEALGAPLEGVQRLDLVTASLSAIRWPVGKAGQPVVLFHNLAPLLAG